MIRGAWQICSLAGMLLAAGTLLPLKPTQETNALGRLPMQLDGRWVILKRGGGLQLLIKGINRRLGANLNIKLECQPQRAASLIVTFSSFGKNAYKESLFDEGEISVGAQNLKSKIHLSDHEGIALSDLSKDQISAIFSEFDVQLIKDGTLSIGISQIKQTQYMLDSNLISLKTGRLAARLSGNLKELKDSCLSLA